MIRATTLILLTTFVSVSHACPWWCQRRSPRPVVVYYYYPPPTPVVAAEPPPLVKKERFDPEAIYQKAVGSCVYIVTPVRGGLVEGSGTLIDREKRLVITTHRVVDDEDLVFAQFPMRTKDDYVITDREKYLERIPAGFAVKGKVLFRDKARDLALIQLDRVPVGTRAVPLASTSVRVGDEVMQIGNLREAPKLVFQTGAHTVQRVSVENLAVPLAGMVLRIRCWVVTTTTATGDSGGPLIDRHGRLVAVSEGAAQGAAARYITWSIEVTEVRAFLAEKKIKIDEPPLPKGEPDLDRRPPRSPDRDIPEAERPKGSTPTAADERAAAELLKRGKLFSDGEDNRQTYIAKLRQLIAKYPGTAAARAAQRTLDGLK
jgi:S1-C subfamily serine protease